MANVAKTAILRAKLAGVLTDLMPKTITDNVFVDASTTLTAHLATLAAKADLQTLQQTVDALGDLASKDKVSQADLDEALATLIGNKAEASALTEEIARAKAAEEANAGAITTIQGQITTLIGEDAGKSARTIANEELAKQLIPESAQESLDTLGEIAAWIQEHPGDASAMNAAITALQQQMTGIDAGEGTVKKYVDDAIAALSIGDYAKAADLTALAAKVDTGDKTVSQYVADAIANKADKATTLEGYGITDAYTGVVIDQKIADAVRNATGGESAASVKSDLEAYKTSNNGRVDALEAKAHEHANKTVLDGITADVVAAWNGKSKIYYSAEEPANLAEGDLWVALLDDVAQA